ncbi:MAG: threonine/serine exporter family protein, partial [Eubacteriales bacterium]|nr:threonine/serine exporter family protein [Eubacteriales bacterium]
SQVDLIIIGTLMNLVPGVAITNSMRDIIAGDFVSGLTKLTEAVIIAVAIALGTGLTFTVVNHLL